MKILLVDDLASNLKLLEMLLESQGHRTLQAMNGQEGLLRARAERPDLAISDILMPVMDGYALCRAWREDPDLREIPFIFYTATYLSEEDERFALSLGAAAFLRKPMEPDLFLAQIQRVVEGIQCRALAVPDPPPTDEGAFLKLYNERLVQKLDQRNQELARRVDELMLAESRVRLQGAALEAAANGILITDRQGTIQWVNPAFLVTTGFDRPEVIGHTPRILNSGFHDAGFFKNLWDTILAGLLWCGEIVNRNKAGALQTFQVAITPMRDEAGTVSHFIEILQDITEKKRMESEYRHSQKMEAVGRLAGGVAHDFNNMLNVILINAEISLLAKDLPEKHRLRVLEIQEAAERSAVLTRQLLAFSRKQPAQPKRIDLNQVVLENQKMLNRMIEGDIELVLHPGPDLPPAFLDPSQLSQILANLVINARDALPGAGTISIETASVLVEEDSRLIHGGLAPGEYIRLTVSDTGCGMDAYTLEHLFEPFFTTKGEGKGTGLGLAMVYGIIKQNLGAITVYSHVGLGTSIKIYLPACPEEAAGEEPRVEASVPGGRETILVAEDEKSMLKVIKIGLEGKGYRVLTAENPLDAFMLAQQHGGSIDLLITDVVMPGMNGKELQERITLVRPRIEVLFISGYTGDIIAKRGLMAMDTHFIQKPFRLQDLARKVREILDASPWKDT
jgi:PAS domain S-box-containing protein